MSQAPFQLSEPGSSLPPDQGMGEYLRTYDLPQPPTVRFGSLRMPSPQSKDRVSLFGQAWVPNHARGTVLLIHGFAEHAGNYAQLIRDFTSAQLAVAMLDLRGHGLSEGPRGHVNSPTEYAEDVAAFLETVYPNLLPSRPLYLWAHSLGALIGLQLVQRKMLNPAPATVVLTSPLLGFPELHGAQKFAAKLAPLIAKVLPSLPVSHGIPASILSHDQAYLAKRAKDPLIARVATPNWLINTAKAVADVQAHAVDFRELAPTLLMLAGDEQVTNLGAAREFAHKAYSDLRHKVVEFPGCFHELEKEPTVRDRVVGESKAWFRA